MNSLFVIAPYKSDGMWVFDDAGLGLRQEPFVSGADDIIDVLTEAIASAPSGFQLIFSPQPFPGYQARFVWSRAEHGGNWYTWPERNKEGWLCPALLLYFESPPREIYVQAKPKKDAATELR